MCEYCSYPDTCLRCGEEANETRTLIWQINWKSVDLYGEDDGYYICSECEINY